METKNQAFGILAAMRRLALAAAIVGGVLMGSGITWPTLLLQTKLTKP